MFVKFSLGTQRLLFGAREEMMLLNHPYIGTEHLFLSILKNSDLSICKLLNKFNVYYDNYKSALLKVFPKCKKKSLFFIYTPLLKKIISNAIYNASDNNASYVYPSSLFLSLINENDGVGIEILASMGVNLNKFYKAFKKSSSNKKSFKFLNTYGVNMSLRSKDYDNVYFREDEINSCFEILCRKSKNNPLLIGKAGVGKTAIVEEIAKRISSGNCPRCLSGYTLFSIPISSIVAGTKYRGEFEEKFEKILNEASSNKVILFMDEVHTIVHAGGAEGAIDASNILKPYLARGSIKMIGATTISEYNGSIKCDSALNRRFQIVNVNELSYSSTLSILNNLRPIYSKYHNVYISKDIISYIVSSSTRFMPNYVNPDKSIDILDLACVKSSINSSYNRNISSLREKLNDIISSKNNAISKGDFKLANKLKAKEYETVSYINKLDIQNNNKKNYLTIYNVNEVIKEKCGYDLNKKFNKKDYDKFMSSRFISNEDTLDSIFNIISNRDSFLCSILLTGSCGTGKSLLPYVISRYLDVNYIYLDMNEFKSYDSYKKITGRKSLCSDVSIYSSSVILFDNLECASSNIIRIIEGIIKNGYIDNIDNERVYFNNTLIFMSSSLDVSKGIGFDNFVNNNILSDYFGTSFVNNIDFIFNLCDLGYKDIYNITINMFKKFSINYDEDMIKYVIDKCDFNKFGGSKIDKIIKNDLLVHFPNIKKCNEPIVS